MSGETVRIVSWNIKFAIEVTTAIRELESIAELQSPDVLLLQEMDEEATAAIANALGANYVYTTLGPHEQTGRDFGNAIVSRWPIGDVVEVPLPHKAIYLGHPRLATRATVSLRSRDVSAYSVHTEIPLLPLHQRRRQFEAIAADISRSGMERVVVGGDFNTFTNRGIRAVQSAMDVPGLAEVSEGSGPSLQFWKFKLPLDHIFASGFSAHRTGVVWSAMASDHKPIWVDLNV